MTETPKDLVRITPQRTFSLVPQSLGEAKEIGKMIAESEFAPKDYKGKPDNVIIAIQMGCDLGLKPMQALQNIAVINGRPSIYGDAALALAMDALEKFEETFTGTFPEKTFTAVCVAKRKGWPNETRREFSIADAEKANLWGKQGPWQSYPKRMLQMRARGFALRDVASDRLLGLVLAEEALDYPIEGTVVASEIVSEPPKALTVFEQLPEPIRDNIEKAFATLNFAPGARLAKLNEFFGGEGIDGEAQAAALLDWLKDEYAKRKTGQPRKKADGNGKAAKEKAPESAGPAAPAPPGGTAASSHPPVVEGELATTPEPAKAAVAKDDEALF